MDEISTTEMKWIAAKSSFLRRLMCDLPDKSLKEVLPVPRKEVVERAKKRARTSNQ